MLIWEDSRHAEKVRGSWLQTQGYKNKDPQEHGKGRIQKQNKIMNRPNAMEDEQSPATGFLANAQG